jgi:hypothetical protein
MLILMISWLWRIRRGKRRTFRKNHYVEPAEPAEMTEEEEAAAAAAADLRLEPDGMKIHRQRAAGLRGPCIRRIDC